MATNAREEYGRSRMDCLRIVALIEAEIKRRNFARVTDPNWAGVGTMQHYQEQLQDILNSLTNQGEYAKGGAQ